MSCTFTYNHECVLHAHVLTVPRLVNGEEGNPYNWQRFVILCIIEGLISSLKSELISLGVATIGSTCTVRSLVF